MKTTLEKIDYTNPENKHKMNKLFIELMDAIKEYDKETYDYVKMEVYIAANGEQLTRDCAEKWVRDMKPVGEHWTYEETTAVMTSYGYNYNPVDFYVAMNKQYSDNYEEVKDNTELCVKLANNWLNDVDAAPNKVFKYWYYIAKRD